ncbi:MAG: hypothetical protein U0892_21725 [Pirellulales bacterium]
MTLHSLTSRLTAHLVCRAIRAVPLAALPVGMLLSGAWEMTAHGQVVNLPSVSNFSSSGSVLVPDQGDVGLGGTRYGSSGRMSRGMMPPGSRASGSSTSAGNMSASVVVIDLQAMDAALLEEAEKKRSTSASRFSGIVQGQPAANVLRQEAPPTTDYKPIQRPANRQPFTEEFSDPRSIQPDFMGGSGAIHDESEIRYFMDRAHEAQVQGRFAAAQVYYRLALERMSPEAHARMIEWRAKRTQDKEASVAGTRGVAQTSGSAPPAGAQRPAR